MSTPEFVHHNILLPDGEQTRPGGYLIEQGQTFLSALKLAQSSCKKPPAQTSVMDLGCLDGGYATAFAKAGYHAIGLDARQSNIDRCDYVKDKLKLPNLKFVCDDARNILEYGPFDITLCFGLLYHLDKPVAYLRTLAEATSKLLVIHGHYADEHQDEAVQTYALGPIVEHEGVLGRWYSEPDWSQNDMESSSLSSWQNQRSFWLLRGDLLKTLRSSGFRNVFEQPDLDDKEHSFGSFVGIK